jgi:superfamily II DNA/RNA helicase
MTFSDLGLSPELLRAVEDVGYKQPTPIQAQAIPYVLMGRDVLGCAQTGTGKTGAFTLPMIEILAAGRAKARMPRTLILEPTRELAAQVAANFDLYGKYHKLNMALIIGGEGFDAQLKKLERGVDVLIATPGRLMDMQERGKILLTDVKILVIDEADRMLDMGFIPDVEKIVSFLPKIRQTLFFSATMPPEIRRLADAFLMNPKEVSVDAPTSPALTVIQSLTVVPAEDKREALRGLIQHENVKNALIFCNRKRDVDVLARSLTKHGFSAAAMHGDMAQPKRVETLDKFKAGEIQFLVASDVAARGIDILALSHVFNFDVPIHPEDYIHRIGRTGRAGREGHALMLATPEDGEHFRAIEKLIGKAIPRIQLDGYPELDFEAGSGRRRGRSRRTDSSSSTRAATPRKSEGRGRSRTRRSEEPRTEVQAAVPDAAPVVEMALVETAPAPQVESRREERAPRAERAPRQERAPRRGRTHEPVTADSQRVTNPRRDEEISDSATIVAFGDHVPNFILRRVIPPAPQAEDASAA